MFMLLLLALVFIAVVTNLTALLFVLSFAGWQLPLPV
jgi:hypothetical protein